MKTKGFTLVELLVVIAILAILATVSVVGYTSYITRTEQQAAATELAAVEDAIETALILNNKVELTLADEATTVLVFTRTATGYTVAAKAADDTNDYVDLAGIPAELLAKLSWTSSKLFYSYDGTTSVEVK